MNALPTIAARANEAGLEFLLAGGHAVIAHGYRRNTFDLDLIIRRDDRERWQALSQGLGYSPHHQGLTFLQFNAPQQQGLPLDLMFVNSETFAKLMAEAAPAPSSLSGAKVVSLRHLLALKCHAVKHGHKGRAVKDADDVIQLIQVNRLDLNAPDLRELFLKHGTEESMKKCNAPAVRNDDTALEFPDWSGMDDSANRVSAEAAFELTEQYASWFPEAARRWAQRESQKCLVEFTL